MYAFPEVEFYPVVIGFAVLAGLYCITQTRWGMRLMRYSQLKDYLSDLITDQIEDEVYTGKISRRESHKQYRRLAELLDMPDLIPKSYKKIKEKIKRRLAHPENYKPINMPKDMPTKKPRSVSFSNPQRQDKLGTE